MFLNNKQKNLINKGINIYNKYLDTKAKLGIIQKISDISLDIHFNELEIKLLKYIISNLLHEADKSIFELVRRGGKSLVLPALKQDKEDLEDLLVKILVKV